MDKNIFMATICMALAFLAIWLKQYGILLITLTLIMICRINSLEETLTQNKNLEKNGNN